MYHYLERALDFIFPPSNEARIVRACTPSFCFAHMRESKVNDVITLTSFQDPLIRALVHEAKFHSNTHAEKMLGVILSEYLRTHMQYKDALWIPIPLSAARLRTRGYNQVSEILRYTTIESKTITYSESVLVRTRDTVAQTSLKKDKRLENMIDAFTINYPDRIKGKNVIIVDDVTTTGATLHAAKTAFLPHAPASITLIALAH